jgi:hypothetical protein
MYICENKYFFYYLFSKWFLKWNYHRAAQFGVASCTYIRVYLGTFDAWHDPRAARWSPRDTPKHIIIPNV